MVVLERGRAQVVQGPVGIFSHGSSEIISGASVEPLIGWHRCSWHLKNLLPPFLLLP